MGTEHLLHCNTTTNGLVTQIAMPAGWQDVHVGVAVSGGADSMALLCALQNLRSAVDGAGKLIALHVNHQLRAHESDEDALWIQRQCEKLEVPLQLMSADTKSYAQRTGCGLESAARQLRYELLTDCSQQHGIRYLATAHTRNDQVETILFRTLRGTGLRGLAGIPASRPLTTSVSLIRPLLSCPRTMVTEYLTAIDQPYREDSTNQDRQFTRNRLRHDLLPHLREAYNSDVDEALLRLATQASEAQQYLELDAEELLAACRLDVQPTRATLERQPLAQAQTILVSEVLRLVWRRAQLAEQSMTFDTWRQLADLTQHASNPTTLNLPGAVRASIDDRILCLSW